MENLEWLKKVKKADGDVDKAIKKAEKELDGEIIADVIMDYRKIKALEIIAEELIGIKGELNIIASYVMAIKNLQ